MDFNSFFEEIKKMALYMFNSEGEHMPMFYLDMEHDGGGKIGIMPARWSDGKDKTMKFALMRVGIEIGAVKQCCLVHEVWSSHVSFNVKPEDAPLPSEDPNRKEMLMIVGVDRNQHKFGCWEINREGEKVSLSKFHEPDEMEALSNAFRALMGDNSQATRH